MTEKNTSTSMCGVITNLDGTVTGRNAPSFLCNLYGGVFLLEAAAATYFLLPKLKGLSRANNNDTGPLIENAAFLIACVISAGVMFRTCKTCRGWSGFAITTGIMAVATAVGIVVNPSTQVQTLEGTSKTQTSNDSSNDAVDCKKCVFQEVPGLSSWSEGCLFKGNKINVQNPKEVCVTRNAGYRDGGLTYDNGFHYIGSCADQKDSITNDCDDGGVRKELWPDPKNGCIGCQCVDTSNWPTKDYTYGCALGNDGGENDPFEENTCVVADGTTCVLTDEK